jgi:DNA-binding NarL/FixJ family response regulator
MKPLSRRELQIMQYTAQGCTAKEIAKKIGLEPRTIQAYVINIRKKLAAKNIAHAVYLAVMAKIFEINL